VRRLQDELADVAADGGLEVVVVDDGSTDGTAEAALAAGATQVVVQPRNRGKGAAVRAGVLAARGRTVVFTDADLAYGPDQVRRGRRGGAGRGGGGAPGPAGGGRGGRARAAAARAGGRGGGDAGAPGGGGGRAGGGAGGGGRGARRVAAGGWGASLGGGLGFW